MEPLCGALSYSKHSTSHCVHAGLACAGGGSDTDTEEGAAGGEEAQADAGDLDAEVVGLVAQGQGRAGPSLTGDQDVSSEEEEEEEEEEEGGEEYGGEAEEEAGDGEGGGGGGGLEAGAARRAAAGRKRSAAAAGLPGARGAAGALEPLAGVGWGDEGAAEGDAGPAAPAGAGGQADAPAPPTKRQRRRAKAEEEARVRAAELRQLAAPAPQSAADFEKLVRAALPLRCAGTPLVVMCTQVEPHAGDRSALAQQSKMSTASKRTPAWVAGLTVIWKKPRVRLRFVSWLGLGLEHIS
jgi:hypothetical protein